MATPPQVKQILGGKGKNLHTHEMHIRHSDNGGYIAKHDLADKDGNHPTDGQKSSKEYTHSNIKELLAHVQQHMSQAAPEPEQDEQEPTPQPGM
jgi:hypothetical protein